MRFLSNFGCKIIFMCSVHFWHQQDSNSLFKGSIGHATSQCKWPIGSGTYSSSGLRDTSSQITIVYFFYHSWQCAHFTSVVHISCLTSSEKLHVLKATQKGLDRDLRSPWGIKLTFRLCGTSCRTWSSHESSMGATCSVSIPW